LSCLRRCRRASFFDERGVERGSRVNARQHIILLFGGQFRRFCLRLNRAALDAGIGIGDEFSSCKPSTLSTIA